MTKYNFSFLLTLPLCALSGFLIATLLGLPLLRLKGHYFAIATIGVMEAIKEIVDNMTEITGGGMGLTLPIMEGEPAYIYKFFLLCYSFDNAAYHCSSFFLIFRSKFGYALRAIRIDEDAASVMGINTSLFKTISWAISGALVGIAGGAYAYWLTYIDPSTVFETSYSVKMFAMILLGGGTTVLVP